MTVPLLILAVFAVALGWIGIPHAFPVLGEISPAWFQGFIGSMLPGHGAEEGHSNIPLLISVLVSIGGLLAGWLLYRNLAKADQKDPMHKALGSGFVLLQNKYRVDEFYQKVFIHPSEWFAEKVVYQFIDLKVIDGVLHGLASAGTWLGNLLRDKFDLPVVNGAGDGVADGTRGLGKLLRGLHTGKVQQYLAIAVASTVITGLLLFTILMVVNG
jgi:NADH-quinone oxidoreductase subunit L